MEQRVMPRGLSGLSLTDKLLAWPSCRGKQNYFHPLLIDSLPEGFESGCSQLARTRFLYLLL